MDLILSRARVTDDKIKISGLVLTIASVVCAYRLSERWNCVADKMISKQCPSSIKLTSKSV